MSQQTSPTASAIRQDMDRIPSLSSATSPDGERTLLLPQRAITTVDSSGVPLKEDENEAPDAFETGAHSDIEENVEPSRASVELDELPIELITLTDRYVARRS